MDDGAFQFAGGIAAAGLPGYAGHREVLARENLVEAQLLRNHRTGDVQFAALDHRADLAQIGRVAANRRERQGLDAVFGFFHDLAGRSIAQRRAIGYLDINKKGWIWSGFVRSSRRFLWYTCLI